MWSTSLTPAGRVCCTAALLWLIGGCSLVTRPVPPPSPGATAPRADAGAPTGETRLPDDWFEEGVASWYGNPFHGRQTASGERYDMEGPTAAHQTLPFGTVVDIYNLDNGRRTRLRINDRGPFVGGRVIDVSRRGARELGMLGPGTARVRIAIVESPEPQSCWEVQAGSFTSDANAAEARARLERAGFRARVVTASGSLHRVILGPFGSADEAEHAADRADGFVLDC